MSISSSSSSPSSFAHFLYTPLHSSSFGFTGPSSTPLNTTRSLIPPFPSRSFTESAFISLPPSSLFPSEYFSVLSSALSSHFPSARELLGFYDRKRNYFIEPNEIQRYIKEYPDETLDLVTRDNVKDGGVGLDVSDGLPAVSVPDMDSAIVNATDEEEAIEESEMNPNAAVQSSSDDDLSRLPSSSPIKLSVETRTGSNAALFSLHINAFEHRPVYSSELDYLIRLRRLTRRIPLEPMLAALQQLSFPIQSEPLLATLKTLIRQHSDKPASSLHSPSNRLNLSFLSSALTSLFSVLSEDERRRDLPMLDHSMLIGALLFICKSSTAQKLQLIFNLFFDRKPSASLSDPLEAARLAAPEVKRLIKACLLTSLLNLNEKFGSATVSTWLDFTSDFISTHLFAILGSSKSLKDSSSPSSGSLDRISLHQFLEFSNSYPNVMSFFRINEILDQRAKLATKNARKAMEKRKDRRDQQAITENRSEKQARTEASRGRETESKSSEAQPAAALSSSQIGSIRSPASAKKSPASARVAPTEPAAKSPARPPAAGESKENPEPAQQSLSLHLSSADSQSRSASARRSSLSLLAATGERLPLTSALIGSLHSSFLLRALDPAFISYALLSASDDRQLLSRDQYEEALQKLIDAARSPSSRVRADEAEQSQRQVFLDLFDYYKLNYQSIDRLLQNSLTADVDSIQLKAVERVWSVPVLELIVALSLWTERDKESKLRFAYELFDSNGDNCLSRLELSRLFFTLFRLFLGADLDEDQILLLYNIVSENVSEIFLLADQEIDEKGEETISFDEFWFLGTAYKHLLPALEVLENLFSETDRIESSVANEGKESEKSEFRQYKEQPVDLASSLMVQGKAAKIQREKRSREIEQQDEEDINQELEVERMAEEAEEDERLLADLEREEAEMLDAQASEDFDSPVLRFRLTDRDSLVIGRSDLTAYSILKDFFSHSSLNSLISILQRSRERSGPVNQDRFLNLMFDLVPAFNRTGRSSQLIEHLLSLLFLCFAEPSPEDSENPHEPVLNLSLFILAIALLLHNDLKLAFYIVDADNDGRVTEIQLALIVAAHLRLLFAINTLNRHSQALIQQAVYEHTHSLFGRAVGSSGDSESIGFEEFIEARHRHPQLCAFLDAFHMIDEIIQHESAEDQERDADEDRAASDSPLFIIPLSSDCSLPLYSDAIDNFLFLNSICANLTTNDILDAFRPSELKLNPATGFSISYPTFLECIETLFSGALGQLSDEEFDLFRVLVERIFFLFRYRSLEDEDDESDEEFDESALVNVLELISALHLFIPFAHSQRGQGQLDSALKFSFILSDFRNHSYLDSTEFVQFLSISLRLLIACANIKLDRQISHTIDYAALESAIKFSSHLVNQRGFTVEDSEKIDFSTFAAILTQNPEFASWIETFRFLFKIIGKDQNEAPNKERKEEIPSERTESQEASEDDEREDSMSEPDQDDEPDHVDEPDAESEPVQQQLRVNIESPAGARISIQSIRGRAGSIPGLASPNAKRPSTPSLSPVHLVIPMGFNVNLKLHEADLHHFHAIYARLTGVTAETLISQLIDETASTVEARTGEVDQQFDLFNYFFDREAFNACIAKVFKLNEDAENEESSADSLLRLHFSNLYRILDVNVDGYVNAGLVCLALALFIPAANIPEKLIDCYQILDLYGEERVTQKRLEQFYVALFSVIAALASNTHSLAPGEGVKSFSESFVRHYERYQKAIQLSAERKAREFFKSARLSASQGKLSVSNFIRSAIQLPELIHGMALFDFALEDKKRNEAENDKNLKKTATGEIWTNEIEEDENEPNEEEEEEKIRKEDQQNRESIEADAMSESESDQEPVESAAPAQHSQAPVDITGSESLLDSSFIHPEPEDSISRIELGWERDGRTIRFPIFITSGDLETLFAIRETAGLQRLSLSAIYSALSQFASGDEFPESSQIQFKDYHRCLSHLLNLEDLEESETRALFSVLSSLFFLFDNQNSGAVDFSEVALALGSFAAGNDKQRIESAFRLLSQADNTRSEPALNSTELFVYLRTVLLTLMAFNDQLNRTYKIEALIEIATRQAFKSTQACFRRLSAISQRSVAGENAALSAFDEKALNARYSAAWIYQHCRDLAPWLEFLSIVDEANLEGDEDEDEE